MSRVPGFAVTLLLFLFCCAAFAAPAMYEIAQERDIPAGAPQYSDVIMRSLHLRVAGDSPSAETMAKLHIKRARAESRDTLQALMDFHVTRLEWSYINDRDFITKLHSMDIRFGNAYCSVDASSAEAGNSVYDLAGEPVTPPWMRVWDPMPTAACAAHPKTADEFVKALSQRIEIGCDVIQVDDPDMNGAAIYWGGCFCEYCVSGFRAYLAKQNLSKNALTELGIENLEAFNLREHLTGLGVPAGDHCWRSGKWNADLRNHFERFQKQAVQDCMEEVTKRLEEKYGRKISLSFNNGSGNWPFYQATVYDYGIGEYNIRDVEPGRIYDLFGKIASLGKGQVFTMPKGHALLIPEHEPDIRRFMAMVYACGGQVLVPWDIYLAATPEGSERYFGTPERYADLSGFIRGAAKYLDGYERAAAYGYGILDKEAHPAVIVDGDSRLTAVVRARPGDKTAPVVVHLVNGSDDQRPAQLLLDPGRLFGDAAGMKITLLTPAEYDRQAHEQAQASGDFSPLVKRKVLARGQQNRVTAAGLDPWGLLVIEQAADETDSAWSPVVQPFGGRFLGTQTIQINAVGPGEIHYTTDGSEPTTDSTRYTGPIVIEDSCRFKAAAFEGQSQSPVVSCLFRRVGDAELIRADQPDALLKPGLTVQSAAGLFDDFVDFSRRQPDDVRTVTNITGMTYGVPNARQAIEASGWLRIPETGFFAFAVFSNNKHMETKIYVSDRLAAHIRNNHHLVQKELPLEKGIHRFRIKHYQRDESDNWLPVYMKGPGHPYGFVSADLLFQDE